MIGYDPRAPKTLTNLSLNGDLLEQARALGINLSARLETELARIVAEEQRLRTARDLAPVVAAWNAFNDANGAAIEEP